MTLIPPGNPQAVEVNPDLYAPGLAEESLIIKARREAIEHAEWFLFFAILVANKPADITRVKLEKVLFIARRFTTAGPRERIRCLIAHGWLGRALRMARTGQYQRCRRAFKAAVRLDPVTCTLADLEAVPGIGPKTARFFLLHSRLDQQYAVLDTHILHWLRDLGYDGIPKSTPPAGPRYAALERTFLALAKKMGCNPADLDAMIWERYSKSKANGGQVTATSVRTARG